MNRPLKRPGHPWPGQGGISPQTLDELIRRANNPKADQLPVLPVEIRWFRPMSDAEFEASQYATGQDPTDDKPIDPLDENTLGLRALNRLTGDDVVAYCPSMWCFWVESDVEADAQDTFKMDPMERPIEVYFPMYSWTRNESVPAANDKNISIIRRVLMSKRDKGKFPAMFNKRTGRWECISLTEAMPPNIWAIPSTTIPPATKIGATGREMSRGIATFWVNEQIDPDVINNIVPSPNNSIHVYNWLTETSLKSGEVYLFWLDVQTGYYMVDPGAEAQPGTGEVHHIMVCDGTPDPECCVYDALKLVYTPTTNSGGQFTYCAVEVEREKVWVRCTNGYIGNLQRGYCRLGVKIRDSLICNSDDRPVYMFDCGSCKPCVCPYGCDTIDFEFHADGTACESLFNGFAGTLKCLDEPPWTFVPEPERKGWWGEFQVPGMMPRLVYSAEITCDEDDPNNPGETIQVQHQVWLELDCGGVASSSPGTILQVYKEDNNGDLQPYSVGPGCTYTRGLEVCRPITDVIDGIEEYQFTERTYKMGVWVECDPETNLIAGPWVFWLADDDVMSVLGLNNASVNPTCDDTEPDGITPCDGEGTGSRTILDRVGVYACGVWSSTGAWVTQDCCANTVTSLGTLYGQDCSQYSCTEGGPCSGHDCVPIPALAETEIGLKNCPRCLQCCAVLLGCWWRNDVDPCSPEYEGIVSPEISVTLTWPMRGIFDVPPE